MVDLSVKGLQVIDLITNEIYDVYALVSGLDNKDADCFLVFNDKRRAEGKGFTYVKVIDVMPVKNTTLLE